MDNLADYEELRKELTRYVGVLVLASMLVVLSFVSLGISRHIADAAEENLARAWEKVLICKNAHNDSTCSSEKLVVGQAAVRLKRTRLLADGLTVLGALSAIGFTCSFLYLRIFKNFAFFCWTELRKERHV